MSHYEDSYDGLHLCIVCRDRETQGYVCSSCRQQQMIDHDLDGVPDRSPRTCELCGKTNSTVHMTDDQFYRCEDCDVRWNS